MSWSVIISTIIKNEHHRSKLYKKKKNALKIFIQFSKHKIKLYTYIQKNTHNNNEGFIIIKFLLNILNCIKFILLLFMMAIYTMNFPICLFPFALLVLPKCVALDLLINIIKKQMLKNRIWLTHVPFDVYLINLFHI